MVSLKMIEEFLLFLFCLEIKLVLNLAMYSESKVDSIFFADFHMWQKKKRKVFGEKKKVRKRISQFKYISVNFCSTSQCELNQLSFHILKQCFQKQEKDPTSVPHRCPFKSGTRPSNARIHHFNVKMPLLMEALPALQPLGSSCYKVYFKYHKLNLMFRYKPWKSTFVSNNL